MRTSKFMNDSVLEHFDLTIIPDPKSADIPISLICSWGFPVDHFLQSQSIYKEGASVADFRGIIPTGFERYFKTLYRQLDIHIYSGPNKNVDVEIPTILPERIQFMSQYKFIIVAEEIFEEDW